MPPELLSCCRGLDFVATGVGRVVGGGSGDSDGEAVCMVSGVGRFEGASVGDLGGVPGGEIVGCEG